LRENWPIQVWIVFSECVISELFCVGTSGNKTMSLARVDTRNNWNMIPRFYMYAKLLRSKIILAVWFNKTSTDHFWKLFKVKLFRHVINSENPRDVTQVDSATINEHLTPPSLRIITSFASARLVGFIISR